MHVPPTFTYRSDSFEKAVLCFWLPAAQVTPENWYSLGEHACNGYRLDYLEGSVLPLIPSPIGQSVLDEIVSEKFAANCRNTSLSHGVEQEHRSAYTKYLIAHGLDVPDLTNLLQGVYPLELNARTLLALGVKQPIPNMTEVKLLILGENCA